MPPPNAGAKHVLCLGPTGTPRTGQAIATETWAAHSKLNVTVINNNFEGRSRIARLGRSLILPIRVIRETLRNDPKAMYLSLKRSPFGALADLACVMAYRLIGARSVVVHLHGADLATAQKVPLINALFTLLWGGVTEVIVLSPGMVEQMGNLPSRRTHVINNFSEEFASVEEVVAKASMAKTGQIKVLFLSNIMYTKGFTFLIDAISQLRREGHDITLKLAGKPLGDNVMNAKDAIAQLESRITDGILYLGSVDGAEKRALLSEAHVVALPTFYPIEAQPLSLIEGMAFGAAPLTTRHNYNEEFLEPHVATFVDPRSTKSIADALRILCENRTNTTTRMLQSLRLARSRYEVVTYAKAIDHVILQAIDAPGEKSTQR